MSRYQRELYKLIDEDIKTQKTHYYGKYSLTERLKEVDLINDVSIIKKIKIYIQNILKRK